MRRIDDFLDDHQRLDNFITDHHLLCDLVLVTVCSLTIIGLMFLVARLPHHADTAQGSGCTIVVPDERGTVKVDGHGEPGGGPGFLSGIVGDGSREDWEKALREYLSQGSTGSSDLRSGGWGGAFWNRGSSDKTVVEITGERDGTSQIFEYSSYSYGVDDGDDEDDGPRRRSHPLFPLMF
jgi:hypothetical protein